MRVLKYDRINEMVANEISCEVCGFRLFNCVASLSSSTLAFVDDSRYPGRCILGLNSHSECVDSLSVDEYASYFDDLRRAVRAIRRATECDRINIYLLGNNEPHLHFHIVPRFGEFTHKSPPTHFNDAREQTPIPPQERRSLVNQIQKELKNWT